jgi:hypothetical protein
MTPIEFAELTSLIDTYNYENETEITPESLHAKWWTAVKQLKEAPNKEALLEGWKYKKEFESAEYSQTHNENKHISLDNPEQRFLLDFWLCVYH